MLPPAPFREHIPALIRRCARRTGQLTAVIADLAMIGPLTDREREVVTLVGLGLTNNDIAARLTISPTTAKTHVSRSMVKRDACDRAQAVVFAYDSGMVTPPTP